MASERRNLYRILHIQPEAPPEVIKAAYRALMTTLRAHPDLGGDHDQAARLNAAYEVLGDAERRRDYDRAMRKPARGAAAESPATAADPWSWLADRRCPFCHHAFAGQPRPELRCGHCDSPLAVAPTSERAASELLGRRRGERYARDLGATFRVPGEAADRAARLRDLSLTGLSLLTAQRIAKGTPLRVVTPNFDAVAAVVACRPYGAAFTAHARLLTLQMRQHARGVYVSATA
jgi:curved DNA-binding protein CbpA